MENKILTAGDIVIDHKAHEVRRQGEYIDLSIVEYYIFTLLAERQNEVVHREDIMRRVEWEKNKIIDRHNKGLREEDRETKSRKFVKYYNNSNVIDVYISYLRRKIDDGQKQKIIKTVRDCGYKLKV